MHCIWNCIQISKLMFSVLTQSLRVKQATEYRRILLALPHEHLTGSIKVIRDPQRNAHQDDVCGVSDTGFDHHRPIQHHWNLVKSQNNRWSSIQSGQPEAFNAICNSPHALCAQRTIITQQLRVLLNIIHQNNDDVFHSYDALKEFSIGKIELTE